jgi:hypothetical protein
MQYRREPGPVICPVFPLPPPLYDTELGMNIMKHNIRIFQFHTTGHNFYELLRFARH